MKLKQKPCKNCGKLMTLYSSLNKFCKKGCKDEFEKGKRREKRDKKKESISVLKKVLWKIVSEYVRLRDSDENNNCTCVTCGLVKHYKKMQAGHYVPVGVSSFHQYNDKNIHPQCYGCNIERGGNLIEYRPFMIQKYGIEYVEWLENTRKELCIRGVMEIKELIDQYKSKLAEIKSNKIL